MKNILSEELSLLQGGDTCSDAGKIEEIACAVTIFGWGAALIAGPTCLGLAIGRAIGC